METIKLFGKESCHKTSFYKQWLSNSTIPFDFYELENNEMNSQFLSHYYDNGAVHFPTLIIGNKTLRNPSISKIDKQILMASVAQVDEGYSEVFYRQHKYGVTKETFNNGKSIKVYAKNLSNGDFISFNMYVTKTGLQLKPCEMPEAKVFSFLKGYNHNLELSHKIENAISCNIV